MFSQPNSVHVARRRHINNLLKMQTQEGHVNLGHFSETHGNGCVYPFPLFVRVTKIKITKDAAVVACV